VAYIAGNTAKTAIISRKGPKMTEKTPELPPEVDAAVIAGLLNIGLRRLQQLAADGIIPRPRKGKYLLADTVRAYCKYLQEAAQAHDAGGLQGERARLTKSRADIAEIERAKLAGDLLSKDDVRSMNVAIASTIKTRMLSVPRKYAPRLVMIKNAREVEIILQPGIEEALEELAALEVVCDSFVRESGGVHRGRRRYVPRTTTTA
jgi:phage terminase Nu1 subunit (DNA packaging protein)